MKKKLFKILGVILVVLMILLIVAPFYLESRIEPILKRKVNASILGTFDFEEVELKLLRNFPNAGLTIEGLSVVTEAPFEGDTLIKASRLHLVMGISELFKGAGDPISIRQLDIEGADLRLLSDENERVNYLISIEAAAGEDAGAGSRAGSAAISDMGASAMGDSEKEDPEGFTFSLESYTIDASRISYTDMASDYTLLLEDIKHRGSGDLSLEQSELQTHTEARLSFEMDSISYLNRHELEWDALLGIDLETDTYTLKENTGRINRMPLEMDGWLRLLDEGQEFDLQFSTPDSDFKNLLALIPATYAGNLEEVTTSGQLTLEGEVNGLWDENRIPAFTLGIEAKDGNFKYGGMPLGMEAIQLVAVLQNSSGIAKDTYLELSQADFMLAGERFAMNGKVSELGGNPQVSASIRGALDLEGLSGAIPVLRESGLKGKLKGELQTAFDLAAIEAGNYGKTRTTGSVEVRDLQYKPQALADSFTLQQASLRFDPQVANLASLSGTLGKSDFKLQGTLKNYLGYALGKGVLEGRLNMESDRLELADFQPPENDTDPGNSEENGTGEKPVEVFELPGNMNLSASVKAGILVYDDLEMQNVSGELQLREQQLILKNLRSNSMDGILALQGSIMTGSGAPRFDLDLGIEGFHIAKTLETLELMQLLAPVASLIEGTFNSQLRLSGALNEDFSPDLQSLTGRVAAEVLGKGLSGRKAEVVDALNQKLEFFDPQQLDLAGLKTTLAFEDGLVAVSPFTFAYQDIEVTVSGGHTFDQKIDYTATFEVPARYLGAEVTRLLAELKDPELGALTVPVTANIGGRYKAPTVSTDLKAAATDLTRRLVDIQKQRLVAGGKEKARDVLEGLLKRDRDSSSQDSTKTTGGLKDLLKGVKGVPKPESPEDSTQKNEKPLEKAARGILGGLLGKKKDSASAAKDSIQKKESP